MANRAKRSRKNPPARRARRPAPRKDARARRASATAERRQRPAAAKAAVRRAAARGGAALVMSRSVRPISRMTGWSTLRVVWRPAIAMATLPYRVYRVYRWAEAESTRSGFASPAAP